MMPVLPYPALPVAPYEYLHQEAGVPEYAIQENYVSHELFKAKVFKAMDQLEGWCSHYKASVLMDMVFLLQPTTVVEIGVFGGKSLVPMAFALRENKKGMIYGIDPWSQEASCVGAEGDHYEWWSQLNHHTILKGLLDKIAKFELGEQIELIQATSEEAPEIPNIDILHIDGNHADETSFLDVTKWVPLVRSGGLVIFDDIGWAYPTMQGNARAVEWLDNHCTRFSVYQGGNYWGIWVKP